jgi:predicted amidohydrolase YtcJ
VAGYGTQVLDLEGKVVVPGFIDSHVHFISGGLQVLYIQTRSLNDSMFFSFLRVVIFLLK